MLLMPRPAAHACWRSTRPSGCETLRIGPLHVYADWRTPPAEDRRCLSDARAEAGKPRQFAAERGLDLELRSRALALGFETNVDVSSGRSAPPHPAHRERRERHLRQAPDVAIELARV